MIETLVAEVATHGIDVSASMLAGIALERAVKIAAAGSPDVLFFDVRHLAWRGCVTDDRCHSRG